LNFEDKTNHWAPFFNRNGHILIDGYKTLEKLAFA